MKKTNFNRKPVYSVAMSQETGCIVMVQMLEDDQLKVMGSLDREQSVKLAEEILDFIEVPDDLYTGNIDKDVKRAVARYRAKVKDTN